MDKRILICCCWYIPTVTLAEIFAVWITEEKLFYNTVHLRIYFFNWYFQLWILWHLPKGKHRSLDYTYCASIVWTVTAIARKAVCIACELYQGQFQSVAAKMKTMPQPTRAGSTAGQKDMAIIYINMLSQAHKKQKTPTQQLGRAGSSPKAG